MVVSRTFEPGVAHQTTLTSYFALWDDLLTRFRGKRVPMDDIDRFAHEGKLTFCQSMLEQYSELMNRPA